VDDQVRVALCPTDIAAGETDKCTLGGGGVDTVGLFPPPHALANAVAITTQRLVTHLAPMASPL
jgi:hypothetical protein